MPESAENIRGLSDRPHICLFYYDAWRDFIFFFLFLAVGWGGGGWGGVCVKKDPMLFVCLFGVSRYKKIG